jgi:hypothetical protein
VLAGFEKRREVAGLPQLGDAQLQGAEAGVEAAVAVAVAPSRALVTPGADQPLDLSPGFPDDLTAHYRGPFSVAMRRDTRLSSAVTS